MRFVFILPFVFLAAVLAQTPTDDSAAVLQAEHDGCVAYLRGDADKIANFLTDDYALTNSKGGITTAADDIENARSGRVHYDVFENYDMKVRVYGGHTAIVTGKPKVKGNAQGKPDRHHCSVYRYVRKTERQMASRRGSCIAVERIGVTRTPADMYERRKQRLLSRTEFSKRVGRHGLVAFGLLLFGLEIGVLGYHWLGDLSWISSLLNAS